MLYLAIDQHRKQLTVNLRNETGDVMLKRQVSTDGNGCGPSWRNSGSEPAGRRFVAILEVCGFNDWLLKLLDGIRLPRNDPDPAREAVKKKTDRRDANALGEILWVNRQRLLAGKKVQGIRRVHAAQRAGRGGSSAYRMA